MTASLTPFSEFTPKVTPRFLKLALGFAIDPPLKIKLFWY